MCVKKSLPFHFGSSFFLSSFLRKPGRFFTGASFDCSATLSAVSLVSVSFGLEGSSRSISLLSWLPSFLLSRLATGLVSQFTPGSSVVPPIVKFSSSLSSFPVNRPAISPGSFERYFRVRSSLRTRARE